MESSPAGPTTEPIIAKRREIHPPAAVGPTSLFFLYSIDRKGLLRDHAKK